MKFFTIVALLAVSSTNAQSDCCLNEVGVPCPAGKTRFEEADTMVGGTPMEACCAVAEPSSRLLDDLNLCASVSTQGAGDCCGIKSSETCPAGKVYVDEFDTMIEGVEYTACCAGGNSDGSAYDDINMCDGSVNPKVSTTSEPPVIDGCCGTFTGSAGCPAEKVLVPEVDTMVEGEKLEVCCDPDENQELFTMNIARCDTGEPVMTITTPVDPATASAPVDADGCCTTTMECTSPKVKVGFNPMVNVCCESDGNISELVVADLNTCTATADTTTPSSADVAKAAVGMVVAAVATLQVVM